MEQGVIKGIHIKDNDKNTKKIVKPVIFKYLSTYVNLKLFKIFKGSPSTDLDHILKVVGLEKFKKTKITKYTPEMNVKIVLAEKLLLDISPIELIEPTYGLDYQGQIEIKNLINEVRVQENKDFIVYSSNMEELKFICSNIS